MSRTQGQIMREETYKKTNIEGINFFGNPSHQHSYGREIPKPKNNNYGKVALAVLGSTALGLGSAYVLSKSKANDRYKTANQKYRNKEKYYENLMGSSFVNSGINDF